MWSLTDMTMKGVEMGVSGHAILLRSTSLAVTTVEHLPMDLGALQAIPVIGLKLR